MSYDLLYGKDPNRPKRLAIAAIGGMAALLFSASSIVLITHEEPYKPPTKAEEVAAAKQEEAKLVKENGGKPLSARQIVLRAMDKARTYRFTRTMKQTGVPQGFAAKVSGTVDASKDLTLTRTSVEVDGKDQRTVSLQHEDDTYVQITDELRAAHQIPPGKRWAIQEFDKRTREFLKSQRWMNDLDQDEMIGRVKARGDDRIGDARVRRFTATLNLEPLVKAMKKSFKKSGFPVRLEMTGKMDIWIDERGYVLRTRSVMDQRVNDQKSRLVMTEKQSHHDRPVGLSVPRKSEIFVIKADSSFGEFSGSSESEGSLEYAPEESSEPSPAGIAP